VSAAISAEGSTALIGGRLDNGSIGAGWIFTRSGATWTQQAKLTGSGETGKGNLGRSGALSADGNTALIGGPADNTNVWAAWVFTRSGTTWAQQGSKLTASGESGPATFGRSAALSSDGNTALLGGPADNTNVGAAWVFTRSGAIWTQQGSKLTGSGESGAGTFGLAVTLSADASTALIGGPADNSKLGASWVVVNSANLPTVTNLSPSAGPVGGGTSVTITGTNFTGATAVKFGANSATSFTVNSATSITAVSPTGTGTVDVTVSTPAGTSATGVADQFSYGSSPTVTNVNPSAGPESGGTSVTVTGTNFTGATAVKFGSTGAASFVVNSATSITAVSPAGTGTVDVTVSTPAGTSATSSADQFGYAPPPAVTNVNPNAGPESGGTSVNVTGTNLTGATAVKFGAANAASFTVNSATSITAVSPAGTGTVDVTVSTAGGTSATGTGDQFSYVPPPTVTNVNPNAGPLVGGTAVTITGTNLTGATGVRFGSTSATSFTVNSATSISAVSPVGTGTVDVTVSTVGGTSATGTADQFSYVPPPTVTKLRPNAGPVIGGTGVAITGTNFTGATAVKFGSVSAASFTVNSPTSISAVSPAQETGIVNITVTTAGGTSQTSSVDRYSVQPMITSLNPNTGPSAGGTSVTVGGAGFSLGAGTVFRFGKARALSVNCTSTTTCTLVTPAHAAGTVDVKAYVHEDMVTSQKTLADRFTYS
jgi:IPT/TIG domain